MSRLATVIFLAGVSLAGFAATCPSTAVEISRDRAIDIARTHATFEIASIETAQATENGRPVWRVTLQGKPLSPDHPALRPTIIVYLDRQSGEVISIAKS